VGVIKSTSGATSTTGTEEKPKIVTSSIATVILDDVQSADHCGVDVYTPAKPGGVPSAGMVNWMSIFGSSVITPVHEPSGPRSIDTVPPLAMDAVPSALPPTCTTRAGAVAGRLHVGSGLVGGGDSCIGAGGSGGGD